MQLTVNLNDSKDIEQSIIYLEQLSGRKLSATTPKVAPKKVEATPELNEEPEPEPQENTPAEKIAEPVVTKVMVQERFKKLISTGHRDVVVEILNEFGVKRLRDLTESAYVDVYAKLGGVQ